MLNRKKVPDQKPLQKKEPAPSNNNSKRAVRPSLFPLELSTLNLVGPDPQQPGRFRFLNVKPLTEVTLVGRATDVDIKDPSNLMFTLVGDDANKKEQLPVQIINDNLPDVPEGQIVRVVGAFRTGADKKLMLTVYFQRPATQDEWDFHKAEAQFNLRLLQSTTTTTAPAKPEQKTKSEKMDQLSKKEPKKADQAEIDGMVLQALEPSRSSDIGMTAEEICSAQPTLTLQDTRGTLERFVQFGQAYATIDDDHYKLT